MYKHFFRKLPEIFRVGRVVDYVAIVWVIISYEISNVVQLLMAWRVGQEWWAATIGGLVDSGTPLHD